MVGVEVAFEVGDILPRLQRLPDFCLSVNTHLGAVLVIDVDSDCSVEVLYIIVADRAVNVEGGPDNNRLAACTWSAVKPEVIFHAGSGTYKEGELVGVVAAVNLLPAFTFLIKCLGVVDAVAQGGHAGGGEHYGIIIAVFERAVVFGVHVADKAAVTLVYAHGVGSGIAAVSEVGNQCSDAEWRIQRNGVAADGELLVEAQVVVLGLLCARTDKKRLLVCVEASGSAACAKCGGVQRRNAEIAVGGAAPSPVDVEFAVCVVAVTNKGVTSCIAGSGVEYGTSGIQLAFQQVCPCGKVVVVGTVIAEHGVTVEIVFECGACVVEAVVLHVAVRHVDDRAAAVGVVFHVNAHSAVVHQRGYSHARHSVAAAGIGVVHVRPVVGCAAEVGGEVAVFVMLEAV